MRKIITIIIIVISSFASYSQCNYTLTLNDSYGDGWFDWWGGYNGYISIDTNGTNIFNWPLSNGSTYSNIITVDDGAVLSLTYHSLGGSAWYYYENENSWTLTDCNGNTVWSGSGGSGSNQSTNITVNCTPCTPLTAGDGDCGVAPTVCNSSDISNNSTGLGNHNDLNLTNQGCLQSGENYTTWIYFHAETAGTLGFTIHPNNEDGGTNDDYDFAIWQSSTCPPSSLPIRCSWAIGGDQSVNSSCINRNIGYDTGMGTSSMLDAADDSENMCGDGWVNPINVSAGDEFVLLVDNYTGNTNSYTLTWSLSGGATLDCDPLPVSYTPMEYDCNNKELKWQTLAEINNDYFTIETGNSFDIDGNLILEDIYVVNGSGTTNSISDYSYYIDLTNKYVVLSQVDYDGSTTKLETKYYSCEDNEQPVIRLMPNPASAGSIVNIDGDYNSIEIYNSIGQKINANISNNQIIGLSKGLYLVRFDDNQPIKLIIQ